MSESVTVVRRVPSSEDNVYGQPAGLVDGESFVVAGCAVAPAALVSQSSRETVEPFREDLTWQLNVYLPGDQPPVHAADRVVVRGELYDVVGRPVVFEHPVTGRRRGPVLLLRRVEVHDGGR